MKMHVQLFTTRALETIDFYQFCQGYYTVEAFLVISWVFKNSLKTSLNTISINNISTVSKNDPFILNFFFFVLSVTLLTIIVFTKNYYYAIFNYALSNIKSKLGGAELQVYNIDRTRL
jgi:hypothetical protein